MFGVSSFSELQLAVPKDSAAGAGGNGTMATLAKTKVTPKSPSKRLNLTIPERALQATEEEVYPLLPTHSEEIYGSIGAGQDKPRKLNVETGGSGVEVTEDFFSF